MSGRVIVVCGLPGAGKTTLATELEAGGAVRMCPDDWLAALAIDMWDDRARGVVEGLQWRMTRELATRGATVVIEWGTWSRVERDRIREWCRSNGVAVELRYLDVAVGELVRRVEARDHSGHLMSKPMTAADFDTWVELFEAPTPDELALYDPPPSGG